MSTPQASYLQIHDYQGSCWWCGSPADSREHRHKKSDVVRSFGPAPWTDTVVRVKSGSSYEERIQGPNSGSLKFSKVLCANCNNAKSQPFDLAYDTFASFLHQNAEAVVQSGRFRFSRIYGKGWKGQRVDLCKYFIKNICCRLAEDGIQVPGVAVDYMSGKLNRLPNFILEMNVNMVKYELGQHMREVHGVDGGSLWRGDHMTIFDDNQFAIGTYSHLGFDWFNLDYQFFVGLERGGANFFAGDTVRLDSYWTEGFDPGDVARACRDCNPSVQSEQSP